MRRGASRSGEDAAALAFQVVVSSARAIYAGIMRDPPAVVKVKASPWNPNVNCKSEIDKKWRGAAATVFSCPKLRRRNLDNLKHRLL